MDNHHLTKKEKYLLKKQNKDQERLNRTRSGKVKKIAVLLVGILIIGGIALALINSLSGSNQEGNQGTPKIEINPQEHDAGTVSMAEGLVKHTYEIKNTGDGDLKIDDILTSCMCTTAILKVGNKESPKFGMHNNPTFWSQKIVPGETGQLEVTFDPAFHGPQGTGQIVRAVYLETNDPQDKRVEIKLIANVIK